MTRAELQARIVNTLMRPDLEADALGFIEQAEDMLRDDKRVRKLVETDFEIDAPVQSLPSDFMSVEGWEHAGQVTRGTIEIVAPGQLGRYGVVARAPRAAAIVDGLVRFAPEPDATYPTRLTYWSTVPRLTGDADTNWLLTEHSRIYLYAALVESAPFIREDERIATWGALLERALEHLHMRTTREQYSGNMRIRPRRAIGG